MKNPWSIWYGRVQIFITRDGDPLAFIPASRAQYESNKPIASEYELERAKKAVAALNAIENMEMIRCSKCHRKMLTIRGEGRMTCENCLYPIG